MKSLDGVALFRVAEALDFDEGAIAELTESPRAAEELVEILRLREALGAREEPSPGFVDATVAMLPTTIRATSTTAMSQDSTGRWTWAPALAGIVTGVTAAMAAFFALLATGGAAAGGPVPLVAIALVAGLGAAVHGTRDVVRTGSRSI